MKKISPHEPIPMKRSEKLCAENTQGPAPARHGTAGPDCWPRLALHPERGPGGEGTHGTQSLRELWLPWPHTDPNNTLTRN